jgi:hypothetical protein
MTVSPVQSSAETSVAAGVRSSDAASAGASFSAALTNQQQIEAARDVLATLPAPIVYTLNDSPGSPSETVDRLFAVLKDGSFKPPDGPLGAPNSIIGATARAATLFETPAHMWHAMRTAIAQPSQLTSMFSAPTVSAATTAAPATPAAPVEVHSLEDAARVLLQARPTTTPAAHLDWWEAALRFLLGAKFPA